MNRETTEVINKIISILKDESEEFIEMFPNSTPSFLPSTYDSASINDLEKEFKITLPKIYKEFLERYPVTRFHLMYTDIYGVSGLKKELKDYIPDELLEARLLPFAGSEGDYFCLHMDNIEDKIFLFDHEQYGIAETNKTFTDFFKDLLDKKLELKGKNNGK